MHSLKMKIEMKSYRCGKTVSDPLMKKQDTEQYYIFPLKKNLMCESYRENRRMSHYVIYTEIFLMIIY